MLWGSSLWVVVVVIEGCGVCAWFIMVRVSLNGRASDSTALDDGFEFERDVFLERRSRCAFSAISNS